MNLRFATTFLRHLGAALLAPLIVLVATGVLLFTRFNADPVGGPLQLAALDEFWRLTRSLHLWSSYVFLAATALHTLRVWKDHLFTPQFRLTYLLGAGSFLAASLAHFTGLVLRWDAAGRDLARVELQLFSHVGGAERYLPARPGETLDGVLLDVHVPLHLFVAALPLILLVAAHWVNVRGTRFTTFSADAPTRKGGWTTTGVLLLLGVIALGAYAAPAPVHQEKPSWPWGPFFLLADWAGTLDAFWAACLVAAFFLLAQPWLAEAPWTRRSTQVLLGLVFASTFLFW